MNPSRISTMVSKIIDTWHFKFNDKVIEVDVSMQRPRDAQTNPDREPPKVSFVAQTSCKGFDKQKISTSEFAHIRFEDADINKLRVRCEKHIQSVLKLEWRKVLVVGFQPVVGNEGGRTEEEKKNYVQRNPAIELKYDFAVGMESVPPMYYRTEGDSNDAGYLNRDATRLLASFFDNTSVRVFEYSAALHNTLCRVKERYGELNARVNSLIAPGGGIEQLAYVFKALTEGSAVKEWNVDDIVVFGKGRDANSFVVKRISPEKVWVCPYIHAYGLSCEERWIEKTYEEMNRGVKHAPRDSE